MPAGLLFDSTTVPANWLRVGGALFTLIGMQYLGTGAWVSAPPPPYSPPPGFTAQP